MGLAGEPQPVTGECQKLFFALWVAFFCFAFFYLCNSPSYDSYGTSQTLILCLQQTGASEVDNDD